MSDVVRAPRQRVPADRRTPRLIVPGPVAVPRWAAGASDRNIWSLKAALIAADLVVIALAMAAAYQLRALVPGHELSSIRSRHDVVGALALPLWIVVFARYHLYRAHHIAARQGELRRLAHAVGVSAAGMGLIAFMGQLDVARGWVVLTGIVALVLLALEREAVRAVLTVLRSRGRLLRRVLVVGADADATDLSQTLIDSPRLGYQVLGFVADGPFTEELPAGHRVVSSLDEIRAAITATGAEGVIVVTSAVGTDVANRLARELPDSGIHVEMVAALRDIAVERLALRALGAYPLLHIERVRRHGWRAAAKRALDITLSGSALLVLTPVMAMVGVAIKLNTPGPLLFRQTRLGRGGRLFTLLKFRTMVADADQQLMTLKDRNEACGPLFKIRDDPRVTSVGRYLRRFSLDELPQLWNVLRGEMTLVGPRPAIPEEAIGWTPEVHQRLRVKPGITGMWQVCGRSNASFGEYCRLDLYYVDNWSLLVDLTILFKTIPAVLSRRGAY